MAQATAGFGAFYTIKPAHPSIIYSLTGNLRARNSRYMANCAGWWDIKRLYLTAFAPEKMPRWAELTW